MTDLSLIEKLLSFFKEVISNRISRKTFTLLFAIKRLPPNNDWFFNKYPFAVEFCVTNKTDKPFFIKSINVNMCNYSFCVKEFTKIINDYTPRKDLNNIPIQPKSSTRIYGILEIGTGFIFPENATVYIHTTEKTLKYNVSVSSELVNKVF